ncbi:hypothetical protein FHS21_003214 [Phyllobacterium trifolii]|uniref:Uncharacterized protein n=1 Tax=Phyllobacterium trifolii TaxID=300193 RepID=A0A839U7R6_9HYPH|nr:hypothetical protein [Phyllobacterium trifolii]
MHIPLHINPRSVSCRDQEAPRREARAQIPVYDVNFRRYLSVAEDARGSDHCPASVFDEGRRCPGAAMTKTTCPSPRACMRINAERFPVHARCTRTAKMVSIAIGSSSTWVPRCRQRGVAASPKHCPVGTTRLLTSSKPPCLNCRTASHRSQTGNHRSAAGA